MLTVMTLKISLGIFLARIVVKRSHLLIIYIAVAASTISSLASFFFVLFRCGPDVSKYLERTLNFQCTPGALDHFFAYSQATVTALTDCVFAALPVAILWNSNMDKRSKLSIGFIMSLATL